MGELRAGVVALPLDPPLGVPMMGYGARQGVAERVHDPLHARALYLAGGSDLLWIEVEWCLVAPQQAAAVRGRIAARTGVPAERILVGSIHTHSGPDTGFGALLGGGEPPAYVDGLFDRVVEAGVAAHAAAGPARLGWGLARAAIGRNRRVADGPLDGDVPVLRVDRADGSPLAVLFVHGCHPTALGHDNVDYSADWPGAAGAAVEARLPGATAIFALGAHADVDPRTRGLLDLAIPGQSVGVTHEETEALGRELGEAVAEVAAAIETRADAALGAAASRVAIPTHRASEAGRVAALEALGLDPAGSYRTAELFGLEQERTAHLPPGERRERVARLRRHLRDKTAHRFAFGAEPEIEVQVLRIGEASFLALPLEPTVDVGLEWKRRVGAPGAVLGIANGWMRYLPHPANFEHPEAHLHYEILQSTLVPGAALRLVERGEALARELGPLPRGPRAHGAESAA